MSAVSSGFDLYARYTDHNGHVTHVQHRTWDKDLFVTSRTADAAKENIKHGSTRARFEQITEEQYRAARRT